MSVGSPAGAGGGVGEAPAERLPPSYRLIRALAGLLLALFYRRLAFGTPGRIPVRGPLILAANHQNALVDPMLLLVAVPRRLRPVAKAALFRHPLIGPLLRLTGAIPVQRRQESDGDPARNAAMFRLAGSILAEGGAVLIFPEGVSQAEPALMPLRTGTARILLAAETAASHPVGVKLVPVGLLVHAPGRFRVGSALVLPGEPVPTADCVALYRTEPEVAVRRLTGRLADALRGLIVDARDRRVLALLSIAEHIWREPSGERPDEGRRAEWLRRAAHAYRHLATHEPARISAVERQVDRYAKDLELAGVGDRDLLRSYSRGVVWRYALRQASALGLGLPLALWGLLNHGVPYQLTALTVRLLRPSPDAEATYKLGAGLVLYPLCWLAEGWTAAYLAGPWGVGVFLAALAPTGFFALTWVERLTRVGRETRGFLRLVRDGDLRQRLLDRRAAILEALNALARSVPESALAGSQEGSAVESPPERGGGSAGRG